MLDKEILIAMSSKEFNDILREDEVVNELEKKRYNKNDEFFSFLQVCDIRLTVCEKPVFPITPVIFCYLWILDNAFLNIDKVITKDDIDQVMYMLSQDLRDGFPFDFAPLTIAIKSVNFCKENNIDYEVVKEDINELFELIFLSIKQLSLTKTSENSSINFGVSWLVNLCSIVAKQTNLDVKYIMYKMSLTECYYYYVTYMSQNGEKTYNITDDEITKKIEERIDELGIEFFKKLKDIENGT